MVGLGVQAREPPYSATPACVGAPCGHCNTLGTHLPCYNWTAASLHSWCTTLARKNVSKISLFMPTMDGEDDVATEGINTTSTFFYDVMRDFLRGALH